MERPVNLMFNYIFKKIKKAARMDYPSLEQPLFILKTPRPTYLTPCNHEAHEETRIKLGHR